MTKFFTNHVVIAVITIAILASNATSAFAEDEEDAQKLIIEHWIKGENISPDHINTFAVRWNKFVKAEREMVVDFFLIEPEIMERTEISELIASIKGTSLIDLTSTYINNPRYEEDLKLWFNQFQIRAATEMSPFGALSRDALMRKWMITKIVKDNTFFCGPPGCGKPPGKPPPPPQGG